MSESATPTHFERLGLAQRFALDEAEVEQRYLRQSRAIHPDYHTLGSSAEQRVSLEQSAILNESYATLRHPFRRAEYLLALAGGTSATEHKEMTPAFLEEMLELRMEIEQLRSAGRDSPELKAMEQQLVQRKERLIRDLGATFTKLEALAPDDSGSKGLLLQVRKVLNTARYIEGLIRDLRAD